jgi:hypothetical protein
LNRNTFVPRAPAHVRPFLAASLISAICLSGTAAAQEPPLPAAFTVVPQPRDPAQLRKAFTPDQIVVLEKLNRRDIDHLTRAEPPIAGLVAPVQWPAPADATALSPLPDSDPWLEPHGKAIVVHQPVQAFAAYESGRIVRWGPVSTGRKETKTPSGPFHLTWRSKGRHSTDNAAWFLPWYFNFHNQRGVSFHQFDLPGYPASHACVRLLERDAKWLYDWGGQWTLDATGRQILAEGTPVFIVGDYGYDAPPPWMDISRLARRIPVEPPVQR